MEIFVDLLKSGEYSLILPFIFVAIAFNAPKILSTLESHKKSKLGLIKESINDLSNQNSTKAFLDEVLEMEAFKVSTGILAHKEKRELLIAFYEKNRSEIPLHGLKFSSTLIRVKDGKLAIEISWIEYITYIINWGCAILLYILGVGMFIISTSQGLNNIGGNIGFLCQALIFIGGGVFCFLQAMPELWAIRIRGILKK